MLAELVDDESELVSVYYGSDVSEEEAEALEMAKQNGMAQE